MAGTQGPEAVEEAVRNTLQANLGGYLTAIWAQWGDAVPLVTPVAWLAGEWDLIPDFPVVYVRSLDGAMLAQQDGAPLWATFAHRLDVGVFLSGDTANVLDQQCKRYLWAIWKCLMTYQQLDGSLVGNTGVSLLRYGKSEAYPENGTTTLLKSGGWETQVWLTESV
jgi:hypothetical protein